MSQKSDGEIPQRLVEKSLRYNKKGNLKKKEARNERCWNTRQSRRSCRFRCSRSLTGRAPPGKGGGGFENTSAVFTNCHKPVLIVRLGLSVPLTPWSLGVGLRVSLFPLELDLVSILGRLFFSRFPWRWP